MKNISTLLLKLQLDNYMKFSRVYDLQIAIAVDNATNS